jgi:hypothetical protein
VVVVLTVVRGSVSGGHLGAGVRALAIAEEDLALEALEDHAGAEKGEVDREWDGEAARDCWRMLEGA